VIHRDIRSIHILKISRILVERPVLTFCACATPMVAENDDIGAGNG
jgi:hypothetical protein